MTILHTLAKSDLDLPIEQALRRASRYQKLIEHLLATEAREVAERAAKPPAKPKATPTAPAVATVLALDPTHKVVWFPLENENDPEGKPRWVPLGFRITTDHSGSWWFYHLRSGSWTKHMPATMLRHRSLSPVLDLANRPQYRQGEVISFGKTKEMAKRLNHCQKVVVALLMEKAAAEMEMIER